MKRRFQMLAASGALIVIGCSRSRPFPDVAPGAEPKAPGRAPAKAKTEKANLEKAIRPAPLVVSIAVPNGGGSRFIVLSNDNPDFDSGFDVVIYNPSDKPQRIWAEGNSEGWSNVSLEITAINGKALQKPWVVGKPPRGWRANVIGAETVSPREAVVRAIHPGYSKGAPYSRLGTYDGFPLPAKGQEKRVTMRAVLTIPSDQDTKDQKVWTGRIESAAHEYTIARQ